MHSRRDSNLSGIERTRSGALDHSATDAMVLRKFYCSYTPRNVFGYIAEISRDIGEGKGRKCTRQTRTYDNTCAFGERGGS